MRNEELIQDRVRQRSITERLLLGALREQDVSRNAVEASDRAAYLARASRELQMSLDEAATRGVVRRLALPRAGTWTIVDVVEATGEMHRLEVVHPDPRKQALARTLEGKWPSDTRLPVDVEGVLRRRPTVVTQASGAGLMLAAHGEENLRILREIGFGSLLVVPLIVRARVQGAITFVSPPGDELFTPDEVALAVDLAARCALALDNARMYREADALRLAAETANLSKAEFLGNMSHELRTPLNAIGGFTSLLEMEIEGPLTEGQRMALGRIRTNQEHLLKLITGILDFVRVDTGRIVYRQERIPMEKALGEVAEMLGGAIGDKGLKLGGIECAGEPIAWADPDRVRQILLNLVMNAVKYATEKGAMITLSCAVAGDMVMVTVADTGPGIPSDKLESIFEPFVQLTSGLTDRQGGVGLGLAISRDLARGMEGDLTVESEVDAGSRFTLSLPLATG